MQGFSYRWLVSLGRGFRHISRWTYVVVALYWLGTILTEAAALRLNQDFQSLPLPWPRFYLKHGLLSLYWLAASVLALAWYAEHPFTSKRLGRNVALTVSLVLTACAGFTAWALLIIPLVTDVSAAAVRSVLWSSNLLYACVTAVQIIIVANAYHYYRELQSRRRESAELQLKLVNTELMLFRSQLEPHFLFNALNSIASLVRLHRNEAAVSALNELAALLRSILEVGQRQVMPWHWERQFAQLYVGLQKLRFAEQLEVSFDTEQVAPGTLIPILLLQPLLENAIHHGPLADGEHCEVSVRLRSSAGVVLLEVSNAVARSGSEHRGGLGLSNLEARLKSLYGGGCSFRSVRADGRFTVRAQFPALLAVTE